MKCKNDEIAHDTVEVATFGSLTDLTNVLQNQFGLEHMKILLKDWLSQTCLVYLLICCLLSVPTKLFLHSTDIAKGQSNTRLGGKRRENIEGYKKFTREGSIGGIMENKRHAPE